MAPASTAQITMAENGSTPQLNPEQVLKASTALLKHMSTIPSEDSKLGKQNLLRTDDADADDYDGPTEDHSTTIWLNLTTKKHITDLKRLKPARISVPHSLHKSTTSTICLITADPQRTYKDIVTSPAFPASLSARITRVIGLEKIKKRYTQYEAQRQLLAEHDIFLADDRIITLLPRLLGKTFYKTTAKRPIPVSIQAPAPKTDGKRIARAKGENGGAGKPAATKAVAAEIEKAIQGALVHLSPSANTSVRVGYKGWDAKDLAENVEAVTNALVERFVPKKWNGVKAIYIKGPETAALPIWLADELWAGEEDVLDDEEVKEREKVEANKGKKRKSKALEGVPVEDKGERQGKSKKIKLLEGNDDNLDKEIKARKESLRKQKEEAERDGEEEAVRKVAKKAGMSKVVA